MNLSSHYESKRNRRWLSIIAAMVAAGLTAFAVYDGATSSETASAGPEASDTAKVEPIGNTGLKRVILTKSAAKRLDIQTAPARQAVVSGKQRIVIPYSAVLYDADGATWTYTSPKPLVFVRHDIRVDAIEGNRAVLGDGPAAGTAVVTVGAPEVWGIEYGEIEED
jgi:hypothetical protein